MTQPAFDPTMFGGQPSTPPIPMVVCWADLDPNSYVSQLSDLAEWITWLRSTYRIPATVIPPCWFTHPGIREDIGHLWTGWLLTRHPDAGVGMIGLEWDQRRDTVNRLSEATAVAGCTASRHQPEPAPANSTTNAVDRLWQEHLNSESHDRARAITRHAVVEIVIEILQAAELRHELAPAILAELADDSATADEQKRIIAERLLEHAVQALERAASGGADATTTIVDAQQHAAREAVLADARDGIAMSLASTAMNPDASSASLDQNRPTTGSTPSSSFSRPGSQLSGQRRRRPLARRLSVNEPQRGVATRTSTISSISGGPGIPPSD